MARSRTRDRIGSRPAGPAMPPIVIETSAVALIGSSARARGRVPGPAKAQMPPVDAPPSASNALRRLTLAGRARSRRRPATRWPGPGPTTQVRAPRHRRAVDLDAEADVGGAQRPGIVAGHEHRDPARRVAGPATRRRAGPTTSRWAMFSRRANASVPAREEHLEPGRSRDLDQLVGERRRLLERRRRTRGARRRARARARGGRRRRRAGRDASRHAGSGRASASGASVHAPRWRVARRVLRVEQPAGAQRALHDVAVFGERHDLVDRPRARHRDPGLEHERVDAVEASERGRVHRDHAVRGEPAVELRRERLAARASPPSGCPVSSRSDARRGSRVTPSATANAAERTERGAIRVALDRTRRQRHRPRRERQRVDGARCGGSARSPARVAPTPPARACSSPTTPTRCAMSTTSPSGPWPSACDSALAVDQRDVGRRSAEPILEEPPHTRLAVGDRDRDRGSPPGCARPAAPARRSRHRGRRRRPRSRRRCAGSARGRRDDPDGREGSARPRRRAAPRRSRSRR